MMNHSEDPRVVRRANIHDLDRICSLADQLGYPNTIEDMHARLTAILASPNQVIFVIDIPGMKTAGYIHARETTSLETGELVEVGGLVVDQLFRRQGLGKILLAAAEEWTMAKGRRLIRLHSNIIRKEAHRFYQDYGYSINKTQHSFIKKLDGDP
ncbi:MAG: GNAT family N-acetyltransferase [Leptolinea sp.]|nr:GNAT family N-acetyltransferase [Leptolinea sp.]